MAAEKITPAPLARRLSDVAREIGQAWPAVRNEGRDSGFGLPMGQHPANPYWSAMRTLSTLDDDYGYDTAYDIVRRFIENAGTWRGDVARRVKTELRAALLHRDVERHTPTDLPRGRRLGRTGTYDPLANPRGYR